MSFFRALFDISFSEFITSKIIKLLYVLIIILEALGWLVFLVGTISQGGISIVLGIIGAPLGFLVSLIFARIGLEILMVVFGIAENTRDMAWALTGGRKAPGGGGQAFTPQPQPQYTPQQPYAAPIPPPAQQPQPQYPQYPPQQPPAPPPAYPPRP